MNGHKTRITLIALVLAAVLSLPFLVLREITPLYLTAYGFALLGLAGFWWSGVYLLDNLKTYPWAAAIPTAAGQYLTIELAFSAVFVLLEQLGIFRLPPVWFFIGHALIWAFFAIRLILLKGVRDAIGQQGSEVRGKTWELASLRADVAAALDKAPGMAGNIQPVIDALRYSDPMSHASLQPCDDAVKEGVIRLEQAVSRDDGLEEVPSICLTLLRQIKDRNARVKMMK
ncbi:MAG: hypothetical protein LBR61_00355 [Synergistaceae bacterium]|jgi:hypothetical protein|nr:hypothetical protein [Synergistaceae bacterium]